MLKVLFLRFFLSFSLFVLFFCLCVKDGNALFTIESSQRALVFLRNAQIKCVEALRYMQVSMSNYRTILIEQKYVWGKIEQQFFKIPKEMQKIICKIKILEKDRYDYEELIIQLLKLAREMDEGIQMYSQYMKSLDASVQNLLSKQVFALSIVNQQQEWCFEEYHNGSHSGCVAPL